jgi:hypothetical protein
MLKSSLSLNVKCADAGITDYAWESISRSQEVIEHVFKVTFNYLEEIQPVATATPALADARAPAVIALPPSLV